MRSTLAPTQTTGVGSPLVALIFLVLTGGPGCAYRSPMGLDVIKISVEGQEVLAEVAIRPEDQSQGLMYRRKLGTNSGMLFVYEKSARLSFWMKNTFIPLSIAFIDDDGRIVHIEDMAPQTTTSHRSPSPVRFALEVNRGWFKERGIGPGGVAQFALPATD